MPTKKTITEVVEDESQDNQISVIEDESDETEQEDALDGLLSEFMGADNVAVNVYRQGEGKNLRFLFKTHPQEMTGGDIMEQCRDKYGTGDYRIHVREGRRLVSNRPFSVEAPQVAEPEKPSEGFGVSELMALMSKQNEQMQTLMLGTMTALANAFATKGAAQPAPDLGSLVQSVAALKAMSDDGGKRNDPGPVEMLIKGLELAKDMAPKQGETNAADLGLKFMEALPMLQKAGEHGHTNPPVSIPPHRPVAALKAPVPGAQPAEVKPGPAQSEKPEMPNENAMFLAQAKANLAWLCQQAGNNKNPELYAELILDQMGEQKTLEFIAADDALDKLAAIEPGVKLYPGWFADLKAAILELTSEENDNPESGEPVPNGNQANEGAPTDDPGVVLARIDGSGLRREGREGASVTIPGVTDAEPEPEPVKGAAPEPEPAPKPAPGTKGSKRGGRKPSSDT